MRAWACNDAFAVCAVGDVLEKRPGYAGQIGWGFSLADMARLGLANTVYLGEGALRTGLLALPPVPRAHQRRRLPGAAEVTQPIHTEGQAP